jgi:predicted phage-related endonuclease
MKICNALALTDDPDLQQHDPVAWHELRRAGIGGSDVPKLCGAYDNPPEWATPLAVYRSKVFQPKMDARYIDNVAAAIGTALEDLLARLYEESTGLRTVKVPMCCDPDRTWRLANADRLAYDGDEPVAVVELKRPVAFNRAWKERDPPAFARMQCQWYASILGLPRCDIFALVGDTTPRRWSEDADPELAGLMTQEAGRFWIKSVKDRIPPLPMSSERREWLCRRFPDVTKGMRDATEDEADLSRRLLMVSARKKLLEERKKQLQDELIMSLGEAEGIRGAGWSFTWRQEAGRVGWKAATEQLAAELAEAQGNPMLAQEILERVQDQHRGDSKRVPRNNRRER